MRNAEAAITNTFKDPSNAQFRNTFVPLGEVGGVGGTMVLCGEVNGRNAYGAYVGFRRFYTDESGVSSAIEGENATDYVVASAWEWKCNKRVYP
jgi:hypothetical protein